MLAPLLRWLGASIPKELPAAFTLAALTALYLGENARRVFGLNVA